MNLGLALVLPGVSFGLSIGNAYAAGYNNIYSNDDQGRSSFLLDHTVGQGTTAIGTGAALIHLAGGGHFEKGLSENSNAFIFSNSPFSRSNSVGNTIGLDRQTTSLLRSGHSRGKRVLREELLHNWQYRRGGLLNLSRLAIEQLRADPGGSPYPYDTPGTLEHDASTRSRLPYDQRPWELRCSLCDKFY